VVQAGYHVSYEVLILPKAHMIKTSYAGYYDTMPPQSGRDISPQVMSTQIPPLPVPEEKTCLRSV